MPHLRRRAELARAEPHGSPGLWARLEARAHEASREARRRGAAVVVSVTEPVQGIDPTALVAVNRRPGESWFCFEQPDRGGSAVAGLGCSYELAGAGGRRFADVRSAWRRLAGMAMADPPVPVAGGGLTAVGGGAFAPSEAPAPNWAGFPPLSLQVPEISLARRDGTTWMTVNLAIGPDDLPGERLDRISARVRALVARSLPLLDPDPAGRHTVRSAMPPAHYEEAVRRAVERIRRGELTKVVLAREVEVTAPVPADPGAVLGVLREAFPSCFVFAVGRGDAVFLGASPELLVRREGGRASTVALAGSIGRSADPAVDDHLAERLLRSEKDRHENDVVARRIVRALRPYAVWVTDSPEPAVIKVANIQHLARPIRAQLAGGADALELAEALHPTPAVGGEPAGVADRLIPALEGFERGWYSGPVGWIDTTGDGEFCVALRCALLRERRVRLFAGAGIVADSDPAAELAETEIKLGALLPVLSA